MTATEAEENQPNFQKIDPRLREEVGGILERAFRNENGLEKPDIEVEQIEILAQEVEEKAERARCLAEEAVEAARKAAERYELSHGLDDLEAVQHWEAEADSYRREAEILDQEAERLRKYL